jgi:hypothetical protein
MSQKTFPAIDNKYPKCHGLKAVKLSPQAGL